jgi:antitoxin component of MazEF toxin-antitoxin module
MSKEVSMPQLTIVPHGDAAALVIPAAVMESMGLRVGDVIEATVSERQLILRAAEDSDRRQVIEEITRDVFDERRDAYQRLA